MRTGYCGSCSGNWAGPRCTVPGNVQGDCEHALNFLVNELTIGHGCEELTKDYFRLCTEEVARELLRNPFAYVFRIGEFSLGCLLGSFAIFASCDLAGEKAFEAAFGKLEGWLCELLVNALGYVSSLGDRQRRDATLMLLRQAHLVSRQLSASGSAAAVAARVDQPMLVDPAGPPAWPDELFVTYTIDYPFNTTLPGLAGSIAYSRARQLFVQVVNASLPTMGGTANASTSVTDFRNCNSTQASFVWNETACSLSPQMYCVVPADPFATIVQGLYLNVSAFKPVSPNTFVGPAGNGNFTAEYVTTPAGLPQLLSVASSSGAKWAVVRFTSASAPGPEAFAISPRCKRE